jgi:hypothetical protein
VGHDRLWLHNEIHGNGEPTASLSTSPGARALYDAQRARGSEHNPALRKVANRLVGILHGCLKTRTLYNEATPWSPHQIKPTA